MRATESNTPIILVSWLNKAKRNDMLSEVLMPAKNIKIDDYQPIINGNKNFAKYIIDKMYNFYGLNKKDKYRGGKYVECRYVSMWLIRKYTDLSLRVIGEFFDKDHSTVIHGIQHVDNRIRFEPNFETKLKYIESII